VDTVIVALRVVLSLGVVFGLLWYLQRRLVKGGRAKVAANLVTVVGRANVGQKASVVVVDVDGQRLVLGVTEHAVSVLHGSTGPIDDSIQTDAVATAPVPVPVNDTALASATVFARSLDSAASNSALAPTLEFRPRRKGTTAPKAAPTSRLAGSVLSPATWTQTAAALRNGR
jgi:flagellar protein FliO/FliZ